MTGFFCKKNHNFIVMRNSTKWQLTREEFEPDIFPEYCTGPLTICSLNESRSLLEAAKSVKFLWIEDVYTGGILREKAGISVQPFHPNFPADSRYWGVKFKRKFIAYLGVNGLSRKLMIKISKRLNKFYEKN